MQFNAFLSKIDTYKAGRPIEEVVQKFGILPNEVIKLASNENPYGCSLVVKEVLKTSVAKASLYPDDSMRTLKQALAKKFNLGMENFIIGAGSDQVIEFCIRAKCNQDSKILMAKTTFAMYEIYAKQVGAQVIKTPSHMHKIEEFKEMYKLHNPSVVFLCLPNNPLGEGLDFQEVYEFLKIVDKETLIILDGAYQEYAILKDKNKAIDMDVIKEFENVIVLRTFSKAYGLGGMRVGYGIASEAIITQLHKVRPPFNVGVLSLEAAYAALMDECFVQDSVEANFIEMEKYELFAKKEQIEFIPSLTNFITLFCENKKMDSTTLAEKLMQRGLIIRDLASYGLNAVRITIGTKEQNLKVFSLLKEFLS